MSSSFPPYQPYPPVPAPYGRPGAPSGDGPWQVAVEFSNQGQAKPSTVVQIGSTEYATAEQALAAARKTAFDFNPPDPWSPQGRRVYRDGGDGFLVMIKGATATFHMRVRILQHITED